MTVPLDAESVLPYQASIKIPFSVFNVTVSYGKLGNSVMIDLGNRGPLNNRQVLAKIFSTGSTITEAKGHHRNG